MSFMASVRESCVEPLMENREVGARTHPFSVRLGGAGAFGRPESARVLWVGVDVGAGEPRSSLIVRGRRGARRHPR